MQAFLPALQFIGTCGRLSVLRVQNGWCQIRRGPPMQQIADWLKKLGLSEYGERFAENGIDFSVLRHLTDQDLKDMGVLLGHRRKMLAAIGELSSKPAAARAPATGAPIGPAAIPTASPTASATEAAGERRYLTVMFCDLVDSTGIAARLDAEEWRDLVNAYLDAASSA